MTMGDDECEMTYYIFTKVGEIYEGERVERAGESLEEREREREGVCVIQVNEDGKDEAVSCLLTLYSDAERQDEELYFDEDGYPNGLSEVSSCSGKI